VYVTSVYRTGYEVVESGNVPKDEQCRYGELSR
jgi:hypothetical protein